jgi:hypothetical protein
MQEKEAVMNTRKWRKWSQPAAVLAGLAALTWTTAAQAQVAAPTISGLGGSSLVGGTSFGGGALGLTGGMSLTGGTSLTGGAFSGFSGGASGTGNLLGSSSSGATGTSSWRNGFSGNWVGSLTGGSGYQGSQGLSSGANSALGTSGTGTPSPFYLYYANPMAAGAPNMTKMTPFGQAVFAGNGNGSPQSSYGGSFGGGMAGGYGSGFSGYGSSQLGSTTPTSLGNLSATNSGNGTGNNSRRAAAPNYTTSPGFDYRPAGPNVVQSDLQGVLARSTGLSPNRDIRVAVEGPAVVLRGTVASEQDRRLAEGLVRLTPGVHEVRNELTVTGAAPQPGPGP